MTRILNKLFVDVTAACEVGILTLCAILASYAPRRKNKEVKG
jgi:hypothetical protein